MDLDALALTCRHLRDERDVTITKLRQQKHAAHAMCYRQRTRARRLELSNRLLLAVYLASEAQNRLLSNHIRQRTEAELEGFPAS